MKTYEDIKPDENIKVLLWGPPGVGKTSLASTFPGVVFVDCDNGLSVLKSRDYLDRFKQPELVGYEQFDDERDPKTGMFKKATAYWAIVKFMNELGENDEVKTIVLDSLSSFQVLAMNLGLELSGQHNRSKSLAKAKMSSGIPIPLPTQADYGSEMSAFQQFVDQAISFEKNFVFTAHEREEFNEKKISIRREPLLVGSAIRARVGKWFDEVWYLDVDNRGKRKLMTKSTGQLKGLKSRALSAPDGLEDPTYEKIMKEVKKSS